MKRIFALSLLAAMLLAFPSESQARGGFLVKGGLSFSDMIKSVGNTSDYTGFNVGVGAQIPLALGFAIQPELVYDLKGAKFENANWKTGYAEVIANVQWGPDLLLFKPFIFAAPFVGYNVKNIVESIGEGGVSSIPQAVTAEFGDLTKTLNKFEYGLGIGAGIDVWKLQLTGKYLWNFGNITSIEEATSKIKDISTRNAGGFELSLAFVF